MGDAKTPVGGNSLFRVKNGCKRAGCDWEADPNNTESRKTDPHATCEGCEVVPENVSSVGLG